MRGLLIAAGVLSMGAGGEGCGCGASDDYVSRTLHADCLYGVVCSIAEGSSVEVLTFYSSDYLEATRLTSVTVTPDTLARVDFEPGSNTFTLHARTLPDPTQQLTGRVTWVDGDSDSTFYRDISVEHVASTVTRPYVEAVMFGTVDRLSRLFDDSGRLAILAGSTLAVGGYHFAKDGAPLVGHAVETWSTTASAPLVELLADADVTYDFVDRSLLRSLTPSEPGAFELSAGGPPLGVDVLPAGSVTSLALESSPGVVVADSLELALYDHVEYFVAARAGDGRLVFTNRSGELSGATPGVHSAYLLEQSLRIHARAPGTSVVRLAIDGATVELTVTTPAPDTSR